MMSDENKADWLQAVQFCFKVNEEEARKLLASPIPCDSKQPEENSITVFKQNSMRSQGGFQTTLAVAK